MCLFSFGFSGMKQGTNNHENIMGHGHMTNNYEQGNCLIPYIGEASLFGGSSHCDPHLVDLATKKTGF